jgi:hypothetical protein
MVKSGVPKFSSSLSVWRLHLRPIWLLLEFDLLLVAWIDRWLRMEEDFVVLLLFCGPGTPMYKL